MSHMAGFQKYFGTVKMIMVTGKNERILGTEFSNVLVSRKDAKPQRKAGCFIFFITLFTLRLCVFACDIFLMNKGYQVSRGKYSENVVP